MTNFAVYERHLTGRAHPGMTVTVTSRGCIAFSAAAWAALGSPPYVKFLIDKNREDPMIGFVPCQAYEPEARPVNAGTRMVTAVAVLRYLRHDTAGIARRYTLRMDDGMPPHIDLSEPAPAVGGRRGGTR